MINKIAAEIIDHLKGVELFKLVDRTIAAKALQSPPSAVVFLAYDKEVTDKQEDTRELGWDLLLMVPALGVGKGQDLSGDCIDAVRKAFINWRPWTTGGVLPAKVPEIRLEGMEKTLLVYTVRVTMRVMPTIIEKLG